MFVHRKCIRIDKEDYFFFCCLSIDGSYQTCDNLDNAQECEVESGKCQFNNLCLFTWEEYFQEDEWDSYGVNGDYLAACLHLGKFFVVNAQEGNGKDVDFHIVICIKTWFTTTKVHFDVNGARPLLLGIKWWQRKKNTIKNG